MTDKKILLITGWLGYIGSHGVVAFEQAGYRVVILDSLINSSLRVLDGIEKILGYIPDFYECDIRDRVNLEKIFERYDFDGVIHFAGLKAVGESCTHIWEYHENNIVWSMMLFSVMEQFHVKKIIFSSSATVYRSDNTLPLREDAILGTTNPYGTTKLVIEQLLNDYSSHAQWAATILRYFNPIGAHPSGYIGEAPRGTPNNLLPYILDVALGKKNTIFIHWNDYDTVDGTWVRDYIDINDLVDAHIQAYQHMKTSYSVYNVGTGRWVSVREMIRWVEEISGKIIPYEFLERRLGDRAIVYASVDLIARELSWQSRRSLSESLLSAWIYTQKSYNASNEV